MIENMSVFDLNKKKVLLLLPERGKPFSQKGQIISEEGCLISSQNILGNLQLLIYCFSFQKDDITICFWLLHLHQMSSTELFNLPIIKVQGIK